MEVSKHELAGWVKELSLLHGSFLLRSGITSTEYFDKYQFESSPQVLSAVAKHLAPKIPSDTQYLAGLEMGGIAIAVALSLYTGLPCVFVRKKAKEYGTQKFAEGPSISGATLCIVEDVITSGGQVLLSSSALRAEGAIIHSVVAVIDRQQGGAEKLAEQHLQLHTLFTKAELQ
jgi:orotate phosphoribosyltransferase